MPRRRRACVRIPSPPPTSRTASFEPAQTRAASASATNGSVRNDWPRLRRGTTPRRRSVSRTSAADSGTPPAAGGSLGRDEEPVLFVDTREFLLDAAHDQPLGALEVEP